MRIQHTQNIRPYKEAMLILNTKCISLIIIFASILNNSLQNDKYHLIFLVNQNKRTGPQKMNIKVVNSLKRLSLQLWTFFEKNLFSF